MDLITVFLRLEVLFICSSASSGAAILTILIAISDNKQLHSKLVMQTSTALLLLLFCVHCDHVYFKPTKYGNPCCISKRDFFSLMLLASVSICHCSLCVC